MFRVSARSCMYWIQVTDPSPVQDIKGRGLVECCGDVVGKLKLYVSWICYVQKSLVSGMSSVIIDTVES